MSRLDGRESGDLRPITIERGFVANSPGSVLFRAGATGEPVLLERLRRRYAEAARDQVLPLQDSLAPRTPTMADAPRGMPLGLPALTPEQFSLVERWIRGGRPAPKQQAPDGSPMKMR